MLEKLLQKRNSGSSLIFVIVAIAFIGILGTIIMQITLINVNMKVLDKEAKNSFYSTETGVNELQIALENISAEAMKEAYGEILLTYGQLLNNKSGSIRNEFETKYIEKLGTKLVGASGGLNFLNTPGVYDNYYSVEYLSDLVKNLFKGKDSTGSYDITIDTKDESTKTNKMVITLNNATSTGERSILLHDLKITSVGNSKSSADKTETVITTDIKLMVPNLSFEMTNTYPEFTKYAIIADEQFNAGHGAVGMSIDGNVYAGYNGIYVNNSAFYDNGLNLKITADRIITRGNISVQRGSGLEIGNDKKLPDIWTEQYTTEQNGILSDERQKAYLSVYANSNVAGDLALNANYSDVKFYEGYYYGYTFNKENQPVIGMDTNEGSSLLNGSYSSAILLNGNNISLDMNNMSKILLAGRSFISRDKEEFDSGNIDILQGEAISFKGTQTIYMVPPTLLLTGKNPMPKAEYEQAMAEIAAGNEDGLLLFDETEAEHMEIAEFLYEREPYVTYWDNIRGGAGSDSMVYIFYNFKSQEKANEYYKYYYDKYKSELERKIKGNSYVSSSGNGVSLTYGEIYATSNIVTAKANGTLLCEDTIDLDDPDSPKEERLQQAIDLSKEYKSRQLTLVDGEMSSYGNSSRDYRIKAEEKDKNTIYDKIISRTEDNTEYKMNSEANGGATYGFVSWGGAKVKGVDITVGGDKAVAYFVCDIPSGSEYGLEMLIDYADKKLGCNTTEASRGIIIADGDINVNKNFTGLIISRQIVKMGTTNCTVKSDEKLVQGILNTAHAGEGTDLTRKFTHYFVAFDDKTTISSAESISKVNFSDTVSYNNWKKNED